MGAGVCSLYKLSDPVYYSNARVYYYPTTKFNAFIYKKIPPPPEPEEVVPRPPPSIFECYTDYAEKTTSDDGMVTTCVTVTDDGLATTTNTLTNSCEVNEEA
jgi:hypothetical protein